jgi:hypothetical protein
MEALMATRTAKPGVKTSARQPPHDNHRIVVLATEPIMAHALVEEIACHAGHAEDDVLVVAPALVDSALKLGTGQVDSARARAERRLSTSVEALRGAGLHATGEVGDANPNVALADALRSAPADEVIIATHADDEATWLGEDEVIERARRELHKPIAQVIVEPGSGGSARVKEVRELLPGSDDREQQPDYLPPLPLRDRVALVVGICGTITLGVLAMFAPGQPRGSYTAAFAVRFLTAIGAFMVTLWHAVALLIFASVGYRGKWETVIADIVLFGMPAAVGLSLIVGYFFPPGAY